LLDVAARGMNAQRTMLDLDARNVAAARPRPVTLPAPRRALHGRGSNEPFESPIRMLKAGRHQQSGCHSSETGTGDALTELIATLDAQTRLRSGRIDLRHGKAPRRADLRIER